MLTRSRQIPASVRTIAAISALLLLVLTRFAVGQSTVNEDQSMKPYASWHGGELDTNRMTNGGLVLHIPLLSYSQRGSLDFSFFPRFNTKQWTVKIRTSQNGQILSKNWQPQGTIGAQVVSSLDWWIVSNSTNDPSFNRSVQPLDRNVHQLSTDSNSITEMYPMYSLDTTGILKPDAQTLVMSNGTRGSCPSIPSDTPGIQPTSVTDANGDQFTISSSGNALSSAMQPTCHSSANQVAIVVPHRQPSEVSKDLVPYPQARPPLVVMSYPRGLP